MPIGRMYIPRVASRRTASARTTRRGAHSGLSAGQRKQVHRIINRKSETNYFDRTQEDQEVNTSNLLVNLTNAISQGDGEGERVGDKIDLRYLRISGDFVTKVAGSGTASTLNDIRHIVFRWKPDNGTDAPTVAQILEDTATLPIHSPYQQDPSERRKFTILYDRHFTLQSRSLGGRDHRDFYITVPAKKLGKICFNSGITTGTGMIYMLLIGNQATGDNAVLLDYASQVQYKDM